jgi:hypothetical protein
VGTVKLLNDDKPIKEWTADTHSLDRTYNIPITELEAGSNQIQVTADQYREESQEMTVAKQLPDNFLLDLQPANTENTDSNIFTTYSSTEEFTHDKKTIDLNQLEEWHDNDYANLKEFHPGMERFVEGVTDDSKLTEVKQIEEGDNELKVLYPNWQESEYYGGHFEKETYEEASSAGKALDQLHPLLFNFEHKYDNRPISTQDEQYAAVLQECFDEYNDKFDTHVWSFDLETDSDATHGNGFIYDETNNELRILETISTPNTATVDGDRQFHPLIENSNYLNPEHDAFQEYWHPLRFDGSTPEADYVPFREAKIGAVDVIRGIATGAQDSDVGGEEGFIQSVGATTDYIKDGIQKLRNYNENNFDFEQFKSQSKIMNKLWEEEGTYIVGGTVENPVYAEVEDDSVIEDVWKDEDGTLVDYVDDFEAEAYEQITMSDTTNSTNQASRAVETGWNH